MKIQFTVTIIPSKEGEKEIIDQVGSADPAALTTYISDEFYKAFAEFDSTEARISHICVED